VDSVRVDARRRGSGVRAKLLAAGGAACSDVELLALVLGGGGDALVLAQRLLEAAGGVDRLDHPACAGVSGLSARRAALVRAALELGRRAVAVPLAPATPVRDAAAVYAHFRGRFPQLEREVFSVLLLDGKNRVQSEVTVSEGSLTAALVHPREVFAPAIRAAAAAVILVHNHPSGDPTPSAEDRAVTRQLVAAGQLLDLPVYDHVILGGDRFVSFAAEGLL